jgi:hypothetical protein
MEGGGVKNDSEIRKQLKHLARKYGGGNVVWAVASDLGDGAHPDEFGIDDTTYVPVGRAIVLSLKIVAETGGRARLCELLENGELENTVSLMCELDESPQPLTGPVDITPVHERGDSGKFEYWVTSHNYCLARFATVAEALEYVKAHNLELDKVCDKGRSP